MSHMLIRCVIGVLVVTMRLTRDVISMLVDHVIMIKIIDGAIYLVGGAIDGVG